MIKLILLPVLIASLLIFPQPSLATHPCLLMLHYYSLGYVDINSAQKELKRVDGSDLDEDPPYVVLANKNTFDNKIIAKMATTTNDRCEQVRYEYKLYRFQFDITTGQLPNTNANCLPSASPNGFVKVAEAQTIISGSGSNTGTFSITPPSAGYYFLMIDARGEEEQNDAIISWWRERRCTLFSWEDVSQNQLSSDGAFAATISTNLSPPGIFNLLLDTNPAILTQTSPDNGEVQLNSQQTGVAVSGNNWVANTYDLSGNVTIQPNTKYFWRIRQQPNSSSDMTAYISGPNVGFPEGLPDPPPPPAPPSSDTTNSGPCGSGVARATGLVSTPNIDPSSRFFTTGGCVIDSKTSFVPHEIPTYDELQSLYFEQK